MSRPELRVLAGGVTNSRPTIKNRTSGVDTVRLRYRADNEAFHRFRQLDSFEEGPRGECWRMVDGIRTGAYPDGLHYVEARLAALLYGREDHRLCAPEELVAGEKVGARLLEVDVQAAVGRYDLASELRFEQASEGLALLRAMSSLDVPWAKVGMEGYRGGAPETVYLRSLNGRTILARMYDKGVEAATDPRGTRLRFERQRRVRKSREMTVEQLLGRDLARDFVGRELAAWAFSTEAAYTVGGVPAAIERLGELCADGKLAPLVRDRLTGFLLHRGSGYSVQSYRRAMRELRSVVSVDVLAADRVDVPLLGYFRAMVNDWREAA